MRSRRSPDKHRSFTVTQASSEQNTIWLTQEAFDKLQAELENLRGPVRSDIVARISAARDEGDLKENGGEPPPPAGQGENEAPTPPPAGKPPPAGGGRPPAGAAG